MRYEQLEEAGELKIECTGVLLDAYSLGMLQINVQDIIDKTAFWLLSQEGIIEPTWKRPKYLPQRVPFYHRRIIKAEVRQIGTGSLYETLSFGLLAILANPDSRAVLQNLVASIIWAISASGVKGIISKPEQPPLDIHPPLLKRKDPLEIGVNLREIALALAEYSDGEPIELRFKHQISREEKTEVIIKIGGKN